MSWRIQSAQNGSEFAHYGVLGMKWGIRKDDKTRSIVGKGTINRNQTTSQTKVTKNPDGTVSVTGMKNISSATFDNEQIYNDWVNGKTNPFAIEFDAYTRSGWSFEGVSTDMKLVDDGPGSAYGVGYTLNFDNAAKLEDYQRTVRNNAEQYYFQKAIEKHEAEINEINQLYEKHGEVIFRNSEISAKIEALENAIGTEIFNREINGYRELREYQYTQSAAPYGQEVLDEALAQLRAEIEAMGFDYDELKKMSEGEEKTKQVMSKVAKQKVSSSSSQTLASKGKSTIEKAIDKVGKFASATIDKASQAAKNAYDSASSFLNKLFKK